MKENRTYNRQGGHNFSKTFQVLLFSLFLLLTGIVMYACQEKKKKPLAIDKVESNSEIIQPVGKTDSSNFYEIEELTFSLPKLFNVRLSNGPDFQVYSIGYPGGSYGGIAFSSGPDVGNQLSNLILPEAIYKNDYNDIPQLREPIDTLYTTGHYYKEGIYYEYNYERDSFLNVGVYAIEAKAIDSFFVWYHYPVERAYGSVDIVLDNNENDRWYTHVFAHTNPYLSWGQVKNFSEQLVGSFVGK